MFLALPFIHANAPLTHTEDIIIAKPCNKIPNVLAIIPIENTQIIL
jgi:hypothetical protein